MMPQLKFRTSRIPREAAKKTIFTFAASCPCVRQNRELLKLAAWMAHNRALLTCLVAALFGLVSWCKLPTVRAQAPSPVAGPGWIHAAPAPITPDAARAALAAAATVSPAAVTPSESEITPEIAAQARALRNDPRLIFDYVHNQIDYTPVYGALNGATATLLAGRGNDADQAALFIALMRAAGYDAQFVTGDITYSADRLANWVGATAGESINVLGNGGIPVEAVAGGVKVFRVWAQANIGGTWYTFDPAMKEYTAKTGISNLGAVLGYSQSSFMSRAQSGATVTADSAQHINEANIRADLATYSMNLVNHLRANLPTAGFDDVVGGRSIVAAELSNYATSLPFAQAVANQSARMANTPVGMRHTLSITRGSQSGDNLTLYTYAIASRRVTIFYDEGAAASILRVDGTPAITYTATPTGTTFTINVAIDHPLTIPDQQGDFDLRSGLGAYALVHDWNGVSAQLLAQRNQQLSQAVFQGLHRSTEPVRGEALNLIGQVWMQQTTLYDALVDRLNRTRTLTQHRVGILGQEESFFIDIPLGYSGLASTDGVSDVWLTGRVATMLASAFEHGVLLQMQQVPGLDAVSTIRMLQNGNAQGVTTFLAKASNWAGIRSQLVDYAADDLTWFDTLIANGYELVLPQDGRQTVGSWSGVGYIQRKQTANSASMGMIINGGLAGGYGTQTAVIDGTQRTFYPNLTNTPLTIYQIASRDPVDLVTGMFLLDRTDLTVGPDAAPLGLEFSRSYAGQNNYLRGPLGYGWSHNLQWTAETHSSGAAGLGAGGAVNAAALVAYTHVALDLLANQLNPQGWTTTAVATKWAMDQLLDNVVTLRTNAATHTFTRLADGAYAAPVGQSDLLSVDGAGFHLLDRAGQRYDYDTNGRIVTWRDANGNTLTFAYDGQGRLAQVTDALGATLTFAYTGDLLASVTTGAGRSVTFTYTANQLTAVTDVAGVVWRYGYDADNRLTRVYKADSTTVAQTTNIYDTWGRVIEQTDALGAKSEFFYSGYRNTEKLPDGGEVVYFLDYGGMQRPGFLVARQDQAGTRTTYTFDALGRIASMTDRLTDSVRFTYHPATGRRATVTNGRNKTTTFTYALRSGSATAYDLTRIDHPDGAYEQFTYDAAGNLLTWRDTRGGVWTYTYNARGLVLTAQNPTGGVVTFTYKPDGDPAAGALASFTDADAGIGMVSFGYDAHKRLTQITYPGGASEHFAYAANDRITRYTDRLGTVYAYTYDAGGNLTGLTRGEGLSLIQTETYTYDAMDRRVQSTDAAGAQTTFAYNSLGALRQITQPGGAAYALGYDTRRWLSSLTDPAGNTWQATRDRESIFSGVTTPEGRQLALGSNAMGSFTQITDPQGKTTAVEYDDMERVLRVVDRLNRATDFTYNSGGDVTSITLPVIGTVSYTRNLLGLVTRITDPRGKHWDFAYSGMGRLTTLTDPKGSVWRYAYDAQGRLATITYPDGVTETRTYDANDNLTARQFSDGLSLTFTYDALNRLVATGSAPVAITYDNRNQPTNTAMSGTHWGAAYDARGYLQNVSYDGQMVVTYSYDSRGLLTQVADDKTGAWLKLEYDDDMLLVRMERANGVHTDITRDANGRITRIAHGNRGAIDLGYDAADQITQIIEQLPLDVSAFLTPELRQFAYDDANQITSAGYAYDARGRRTADPQRAYTWDAADRLTRITENGAVVEFEYTAQGDIARRTASGVTTDFFYNHAIADRPILAERRVGAYTRFYVYTPAGRLLYAVETPVTAPAPRFYHFNHIGTTLFLTDGSGAMRDAYGYTVYGEMVKHMGDSDQPFTFVGEYGVRQEGVSGLYTMRARTYDSRTIQFLSRDPRWPDLTDPKALNPYQYAGQNPLSFIDPSGLEHFYIDQHGGRLSENDAANTSLFAPVGKVSEDGRITWQIPVTLAAKGHQPPSATNFYDLVGLPRPAPQTQANTGVRASSNKPPVQTTAALPQRPVVQQYTPEQIAAMQAANSNSCGCKCSMLAVEGASDASLVYLLGGLAVLLVLFGVRKALRIVFLKGV